MSAAGRAFDAVLFDWCGTLVAYPTLEERIAHCLHQLGRVDDVAGLAAAVRRAQTHPEAAAAHASSDLSAEAHDHAKLLVGRLAGLDGELSTELAASYGDMATYRTHPEAVEVIQALHECGVRLAVVSDFHVDLRPWFAAHGVLDCIDGVVLSCEAGAVKPARRMFEAAVEAVGVPASRCLMVGDNPHADTGAAALGIATVIFPVVRQDRPPSLERVLALVGGRP